MLYVRKVMAFSVSKLITAVLASVLISGVIAPPHSPIRPNQCQRDDSRLCFNHVIHVQEGQSVNIVQWLVDGTPSLYLEQPFTTNSISYKLPDQRFNVTSNISSDLSALAGQPLVQVLIIFSDGTTFKSAPYIWPQVTEVTEHATHQPPSKVRWDIYIAIVILTLALIGATVFAIFAVIAAIVFYKREKKAKKETSVNCERNNSRLQEENTVSATLPEEENTGSATLPEEENTVSATLPEEENTVSATLPEEENAGSAKDETSTVSTTPDPTPEEEQSSSNSPSQVTDEEKEHIRDLLNDPNDIQKQRKVMTIIDRIAGINDQTDGTVRSAVEETDPERGPSRTVPSQRPSIEPIEEISAPTEATHNSNNSSIVTSGSDYCRNRRGTSTHRSVRDDEAFVPNNTPFSSAQKHYIEERQTQTFTEQYEPENIRTPSRVAQKIYIEYKKKGL